MSDKIPMRIVVGNRRRVFDDDDSVGNVRIESVHPQENIIIKTEPPDEESATDCNEESHFLFKQETIVKEEDVHFSEHLFEDGIQDKIKTEPVMWPCTTPHEQENAVIDVLNTNTPQVFILQNVKLEPEESCNLVPQIKEETTAVINVSNTNVTPQVFILQNVKLEPEDSCSLVPQIKEEPTADFTPADKHDKPGKRKKMNSNAKKKTSTKFHTILPCLGEGINTTESSNVVESCIAPPGKGNVTLKNDEEEEINTLILTKEIKLKLLELGVSQIKFAACVLGRAQGTLSDILNKSKPWSELGSVGRRTYRLMWEWLKKSDSEMMNSFNSPENNKVRTTSSRKRFAFSDLQHQALRGIFETTRKPSKNMMEVIALKLNLQQSTVINFFTNARRRGPHRCNKLGYLNPFCQCLVKETSSKESSMAEL